MKLPKIRNWAIVMIVAIYWGATAAILCIDNEAAMLSGVVLSGFGVVVTLILGLLSADV